MLRFLFYRCYFSLSSLASLGACFVAIFALIGCSSQQGVESQHLNVLQPKLFDPWCDYAVAGQADIVTQECLDNANQGDENAATNLAYLYAKGMLVEQDNHRAMDLYQVAAEQGMPEAQFSLAEMYRSGKAGEAEPELARYWYQRLASQPVEPPLPRHQVDAQFMLGLMHFQGFGGDVDLVRAEQWLKQSSDNDHSEAPYVLGKIYLEQYHKPELALNWYQVSSERKFAPAMHQIGMMYLNGLLGEIDAVKAEAWLQQAAALGLAEAQVDLATLEYNERHNQPNFIKIYVWLDAAASQDNAMAKQRLEFIIAKLPPQQLATAQALSQQCIESQFKQCTSLHLVN